ncbi:uncharacterized protein V1513DRAFT_465344 [Lipomyces chichibuensis]|uniref:uncharacterized protein n=1 Tax=Lipomyces chichibuensis TaxID=1546026 RepID=UPI0033433E20
MNADVHVYDILWTAQVTQKSKVWYDGTLKLHTFNKRAMLYDTSRVLIDSAFLSKGFLHLGETLVMERHLVTIENQTSTYTIDVTPVTRTPRSTRKRIDALPVSQRQRQALWAPCSESPAATCRVSGLRPESSASKNFTVPLSSNSPSNARIPRQQPNPPDGRIHKCAAMLTPILISPPKWSQDRSALLEPHISQSPQAQGPQVMSPCKIAQSLPQQLAQSHPKLPPISKKVNSPYCPPTTVLAPKSPNIGLSPPSSSRKTSTYSNLDVMNVKQRRIILPSCVNKEAKIIFKEPLLTPPDTSSPVKTSSVAGDRDIYDDYDPGESAVENDLARNLSLNVKAAVVEGFQESTKLLLQQQLYDEKQFQREPRNESPTFPSLSTSRIVDSPPEPAESATPGIGRNKLLFYQTNQGEQSQIRVSTSKQPDKDTDFETHAEPEEDYGLNNDVEFGSFSFDELQSSHSSASEFSILHNPDKPGSQRPTFSGTATLEAAELTLTQSEPIKRKLLSISRKSTRRKIVR